MYHKPVLVEPVMAALLTDISDEAVYVDGTLGGGGHSERILSGTNARVVGIDRDQNAISESKKRLEPYSGRLTVVWGNYNDLPEHLETLGISEVQGILLDLGVSSHQFDEPVRGFSYKVDAKLDMRMNQADDITAYDIVNGYAHGDLARVIREYGEEKWASRIATFIIAARPVETTLQLVDCILAAVPASARRDGPHPARRTFQALRIEVNDELSKLSGTLKNAIGYLKPGCRLCVITFHSLEDRIVKQTFAKMQNPCVCPPKAPMCVCGGKPLGKALRGVTPSDEEKEENTRSRSARLRVFEVFKSS